MDPLSQGLLGAAVAQTAAKPKQIRIAAGAGFFDGIIADSDVFIRSAEDPLLAIEFHRHFTHSIFFIPFGGLIGAALLWPLLKRKLSFGEDRFSASAPRFDSPLMQRPYPGVARASRCSHLCFA